MSDPQVNHVHLVGSVPVPTAEDCFRTVCSAFPGRLKRIPDGEPGVREQFIRWQLDVFKQADPRVLNELFFPNSRTTFSENEATDILKNFEKFETHYDDHALESYAVFKRLKDEGVVPHDVRLQVCLPTPLDLVYLIVHSGLRKKIEPLCEQAMIRSLKRIQSNIPHSELSIQWDAPIEMGMIEEANYYGLVEIKPWFEPVSEGVLERMVNMVEAVAEDVEVGIHLCYGDSGHKHFMEPKSTLAMVDFSNALSDRCKRPIDFIHMPVPKDRKDIGYYEPLQHLRQGLELVLGVVHYDDEEGTNARIQAAGKFVKSFSVSTECGMGRTPPEQLENILQTHATVSTPTKL